MAVEAKTAIIIGAGPTGLAAAYELLDKTDIKPIVFEMSNHIGGLSRTICHNGNRIDAGPHRFYTNYDEVADWWLNILPLQGKPCLDDIILDRSLSVSKRDKRKDVGSTHSQVIEAPDPEKTDKVMLVRERATRILFRRKFFNHPISLNITNLVKLGIMHSLKIALSYVRIRLLPIKEEKTLEDYYINRYGKQFYELFFRDFTEKAWVVPARELPPELGYQRVGEISILRNLLNTLKKAIFNPPSPSWENVTGFHPERFMYPKYGSGQLWEEVASRIEEAGGEIHLNHEVIGLRHNSRAITEAEVYDLKSGRTISCKGDYFISSMPVKDLISSFNDGIPPQVSEAAKGLMYRDLIEVSLLLKKLHIENDSSAGSIDGVVMDNWIYVQENDVGVRRLVIYNNWSPYLVMGKDRVLLGMEYLCQEGDEISTRTDNDLKIMASQELQRLGVADGEDVLEVVVIRSPKAYPCYSRSYERFDVIRDFTEGFKNLFLVGRNGMHRYHNQDHSVLCAITLVDNIINNIESRENLWSINAGREYIEG
jgi:protoporphyrinogen oxidase